MSAQLSQHTTTRLLVAEKSENAAHRLDSALRNAGIATRLTISDDLVHIAQLLSQDEADLLIIGAALDNLQPLLPRLRSAAPCVPIIVLTDPEQSDSLTASELMSLGATDAVGQEQLEHLSLVVYRELQHVEQLNHYQRMQRALAEAEQRCSLLLQGSKAAIAYVHEGMHIHANEGYLELFGYEDIEDLGSASLVDIMSADSAAELKSHLKALRNGTRELEFDFSGLHRDGNAVRGAMTLANSQYEGESCLQITIRSQPQQSDTTTACTEQQLTDDAAEPQPAFAELPNSAANEPATSFAQLTEFAAAAAALFGEHDNLHYIMAVGLDHQQELHQAHGIVGTTEIGLSVWAKIRALTTDVPAVALNHHEFFIAVCAADHDKALARATAWNRAISEDMFEIGGKTVRPSISVTGAQMMAGLDVSSAIDLALDNLRKLLAHEKSDIVDLPALNVFDSDSGTTDTKLILHQISEAIEKKNFVLLFQPIISLRGDADEHYEVFLRMTGPDGEQIEPGRFLQTAVENNVAGKIDRWVILQAIKTLSAHRAEGHTTRLTVNISANSVVDPEFSQWLGVAIKAARLPSDAIIFQITEADAVTYTRQTVQFLEQLREIHCRASLSRFGLTKNPFEALEHFPVDMVKLDGTLVQDIDRNPKVADALIKTVRQLQDTGKLTLVPRVENANILSTLWQAGANYIQGHYLQEPTPQMDYDFSTEE